MNNDHISVLNAHTGIQFQVKRFYFVSVDELKKFCSTEFGIPIGRLFLLTSFGLLLKSASFEEIDDIYVYDKELFSTQGNEKLIRKYINTQRLGFYDSLVQPLTSPLLDFSLESVAKLRNSKQLISLLTTNLGWVAALESDCSLAINKITELNSQIDVLLQSVNVAANYIDSYCSKIKKTFDEYLDFVGQLQKNSLNLKWQNKFQDLKLLKMIDGNPLSDLLDYNELSKTADQSIQINEDLNREFANFKPTIDMSKKERSQIHTEFENSSQQVTEFINSNNINEAFNELTKLCEKVRSDTKNLLDKSSKSIDDLGVDIILETFQLHKSNYVEKIYDLSVKIYETSLKYKDLLSNLQITTSQFIQRLSTAQLSMISLKESLKSMSRHIEKMQLLESSLAHTVDLPLLYGLYMVENMRRGQWLNFVSSVISKTNEKFANLREREIKTRDQWVKNYGIILKLLNHDISSFNNRNIVSFEIVKNVDSSKQEAQIFNYEDCNEYIRQLEAQKFISKDVMDILSQSLQEAAFKRPHFNMEIEQKLIDSETIKGYKTRIKKLENLLHQEQFKNFTQWPSNIGSSKISTNPLSRLPSYQDSNSRRTSLETSQFFGISRSPSPPVFQSESMQKLELENKALHSKTESQLKEINDLQEDLKYYKQSLSAKEFSNQSIVQKGKEELNQKQQEINKLMKDFTAEGIRFVKLQVQVEEKDVLIHELEQKLIAKTEEVEKLNHDKNEELAGVKEEVDSKNNLIAEMEARFENDLKEKDESITRLKADHEAEVSSIKTKLEETVEEVSLSHSKHRDEIDLLKSQFEEKLESKDDEIESLKLEYEDKVKSLTTINDSPYNKEQIDNFENNLIEFQDEITSLKDQLALAMTELSSKSSKVEEVTTALDQLKITNDNEVNELESKVQSLVEEKKGYEKQIDDCNEDFQRLKSMKNDLLENMANREEEFTKEKISYQEEIESLKSKIEELEDLKKDDDETDELIAKYKHSNFQLIVIINSLVIKARDLTEILILFYDIYLSSLKSLGLLAVIETNENRTDIIRVKGLRKKKSGSVDSLMASTITDLERGIKPITKDDVVSQSLIWNGEIFNSNLLTDLEEEETTNEEFLTNLNDSIIDNFNLITFEKKYLNFVNVITNLNPIFVSSVSKRFNEVERLAQKELKENKKLRADTKKLAIKDFRIGDLVLFLPTKLQISDDSRNNSNEEQPINQWAAFNVMGDYKFLMKSTPDFKIPSNRQWFISKILKIEKVNNKEFLLTAEEVDLWP